MHHDKHRALFGAVQQRVLQGCGRDSVQVRPPTIQQRNLKQLAEQLKKTGGEIEVNDFLLSFHIGEERMVIFKDGRALIHGTNDVEKAKTLYHRYFS